jgi:3',5'-nucleoside bisphosphate phosphatase
MNANLHLHSLFSDGALWPEAVAEAAAASGRGLELLALTDHDTLGGTPEFASACAALGIATLPGCEIDCRVPEIGYRSELLAYFPSGTYKATAELLALVLADRAARLVRLVANAAAFFGRPDFSFEELAARKAAGRVPPPEPSQVSYSMVDLYTFLKSKGVIDRAMGYRDFMGAYVDTGKIQGARMPKPSLEAIAAAVRSDGGFLVLPHPGHQFADSPQRVLAEEERLDRMLSFFKERGISGVEQYWYGDERSSLAINEIVRRAARKAGLFLSYGSDCHGPGSAKHTIGKFSGEFEGFPAKRS